jgi:hypothetical protein
MATCGSRTKPLRSLSEMTREACRVVQPRTETAPISGIAILPVASTM